MPSTFDHALSAPFIDALRREADRDGWWRDVLRDPDLVIAPRGKYLNVYWRGQALFTVSCPHGELAVTTHEKYLLDPALKEQVALSPDGSFDIDALMRRALVRRYEGPSTLAKLKTASGLFADKEKVGCHAVAINNPGVIDVEVTFPGKHAFPDGHTRTAPRVDLAAFEPDGSDGRLVFWEAKAYDNPDLRAKAEALPAVCQQIEDYRTVLAGKRAEVEDSYVRVAANLVACKGMGWARELSPLVAAVASGEAKLRLGDQPRVGLLVFGYDGGQRDDPRWQAHRAKLNAVVNPTRLNGVAAKIVL